ncbi:hypothetical protein [Streptomyces sp. NPDC047990]|uniref:hypothetical protein n=1 Tax=Streptomyces sp. NPDC047990 TaxID=3365496 RepID=UPI003721B6DA
MKTDEALDFVRAVQPERAYGIHDGQINGRGPGSLNCRIADACGGCYCWLPPGSSAR